MKTVNDAYNTIESKAKHFVRNVDLIGVDALRLDGENVKEAVTST